MQSPDPQAASTRGEHDTLVDQVGQLVKSGAAARADVVDVVVGDDLVVLGPGRHREEERRKRKDEGMRSLEERRMDEMGQGNGAGVETVNEETN